MNDWNREQLEGFIHQKKSGCIYLYTPFCGTCQVTSKMLEVIEAMMPDLLIGKMNLNYSQDLALNWKIESVPCLIFINGGEMISKLYTFRSVPFLIEKIKTTFQG